MTETPGQGAPPAADRVQALLSRAVEEQVTEQRAVSTILAQLQQQVHGLAEVLRHTAADTSIERLGGLVSNVVADLRTATSLLSQRIEALSQRVEQVAVDAAAPSQAAATQIGAMSEALNGMANGLQQLGSFPAALAALQKDVAGLHDRLQPLADLRAAVAELSVSAGGEDSGGPRLEAIEAKLEELAQAVRPERVRDSVVDAIAGRLAKLEEAAARPVVGPEVLRSALGDFRSSLDSSTAERNEELVAAISSVENRLGQVGQRIADIGDAAGAVPGLATDIAQLSATLGELSGLSEGFASVSAGVAELQDKQEAGVGPELAALRDDIAGLSARVTASAGPGAEDLSNAVSLRIADRLVEALAPRIADVVLTRVSGALVGQLGEALSPRLQADTEALVRNSVNESERRVLAHLDEAVLALAEALLRRGKARPAGAPRLNRTASEAAADADDAGPSGKHAKGGDSEAGWEQADYDVQGIVDRLNAAPTTPEPEEVTPRPALPVSELPPISGAVTTSLAPSSLLNPLPLKADPKPEPKAPAKKAAAKAPAKAPAKKAAAKAPAKKAAKTSSVAKVAQSRSAAARAAKAPARPLPSPGRPSPAAKAPSRPLVERTPDLPVDDIEPVRHAPPAQPRGLGRPAASGRQSAAAYRPDAPKPIQRPQPAQRPQAPQVLRPPVESKRKPWWKPGG